MTTNSTAYMRAYYHRKRLEMFKQLGLKCSKCGCINYSILEINHKNGYKGVLSPNGSRGGMRNLWDVISDIKAGKIDEYELLCKPCNMKDYWRR